MTPEQALEILEQATGLLQLTRADHQKIEQALVVLRETAEQPSQRGGIICPTSN